MTRGLWVWPADQKGQRRVLRRVRASKHLTGAMALIAKSREGMSNAELDDMLNDSSEWLTLWVARQLTSLGFIELKVDFFGNPARYQMTELGRTVFTTIVGQPPPRPPTPGAPTAQPAPKTT